MQGLTINTENGSFDVINADTQLIAELRAELDKVKAEHASMIAEYDLMVLELIKNTRVLTATKLAVQAAKCQSDKDWLFDQLRDQLAQYEPTWI